MSGACLIQNPLTPAKAGVQRARHSWVPAFAGMSGRVRSSRGGDLA